MVSVRYLLYFTGSLVESWSGCQPLVKLNCETKHVEVLFASCSDAGSIPAVSTKLLFIIGLQPFFF